VQRLRKLRWKSTRPIWTKGLARPISGSVFAPIAPRLAVLMSAALAVGCGHAGTKEPSGSTVFSEERSSTCARITIGRTSPYFVPLADPLTNAEDIAYLADFPAEARRTAGAAGLEPLLVALLRERAKGGEPTTRVLAMEIELWTRLATLARQLEAVSYEVGCAGGQIKEVLDDFKHRDQRRQFKLAMGSIIVAAISASAAGAVTLARPDDTRTPAIVGIGGGVATAVLGTLAVLNGESKIILSHDPNLLLPVFTGTDPDHLYPTFVFRMLTFADDRPRGSPRARLLEDWEHDFDYVGVDRGTAERLLYGSGGTYTPELAEARLQHLERLGSTLESMARDLELLTRFLVRTLFERP
jgi:hypothetical protein